MLLRSFEGPFLGPRQGRHRRWRWRSRRDRLLSRLVPPRLRFRRRRWLLFGSGLRRGSLHQSALGRRLRGSASEKRWTKPGTMGARAVTRESGAQSGNSNAPLVGLADQIAPQGHSDLARRHNRVSQPRHSYSQYTHVRPPLSKPTESTSVVVDSRTPKAYPRQLHFNRPDPVSFAGYALSRGPAQRTPRPKATAPPSRD